MPPETEPSHADPFSESQHIPRKLLLVILLIESGTIVMIGAILIGTGAALHVFAIVAGSLLIGPALIALPTLRVRLDDEALRWSWHPFGWGRIPYATIETAEPFKVNALNDYQGWGPKLSRKRKTHGFGLIANGKEAVRITRLSGRRPTVITTHDAEAFATAIMEKVVALTPPEA